MQDYKLFAHVKPLSCFSVSLILLILFLFTFLNHQAFGDPTIVVSNTNDDGVGSLRQAIVDVDPGGNILFDASLNNQTIFVGIDHLEINKNLTIDASSLSDGIVISGNYTSRVFRIPLGSVVTMEKLTIIEGQGINGGGIFNTGDLTLIQSTISDNIATNDGGGIYNTGSLTLTQSTVSGNFAEDDGGGICNESSTDLTLQQSTVSGNTSDDDGGGIYCGSSGLDAINCTITGNSAGGVHEGHGGGIFAVSSTLLLNYCTITDNFSDASGGGLRVDNSSVTIENTIVAKNTASTTGPDIELDDDGSTIVPVGTNLIGDNATVEAEFPISPLHGTSANPVDPLLAPLDNYGGPTETMPALGGSPAIDPTGGATVSSEATDQIGSARVVDGDLIPGAIVDIGAVEAGPVFVVTNVADDGPGSLRQSLDEATRPGYIVFDSSLSGQELQLTSGELILPNNSLFTIDASALPRGLTISGEGVSRVFDIGADSFVILDSLTITDGNSAQGGGIYNAGNLVLSRLTLFGNNATSDGGAIYNASNASLTATNCTLVYNSATDGGAIHSALDSTAILQHCTIADNFASNAGGGLFSNASSMTIENTIVAQNSALVSGSDIQKGGGSLIGNGTNLIGDNTTVETEFPAGPLHGTNASPLDPLLDVLGDYGGPTQTRLPLMGSPAIDPAGGATVSSLETDQRGYPRAVSADGVSGTILDIGAVESFRFITVTNLSDSDPGSLRAALNAQTSAEPYNIIFDSALSGGTIVLTSGPLEVATSLLTRIDTSSLPDGLTISGNDISRVFNINVDSIAILESLTITGGNAGSTEGGGIHNSGDLMILRSTIFGNTAGTNGGGIYTSGGGSLIVRNSTLVDNSAVNGGGIYVDSSIDAFLQYCTIADNDASSDGGGVFIDGVSSNVTLENTIIAQNTASGTGSDIRKVAGMLASTGTNFIGDNTTVATEFPEGPLSGTAANPIDPVLAPLGPYGGPTPTRPPLVGSPNIDPVGGVVASLQATDQRGSDRVVDGDLTAGEIVDIGAVEGGPVVTVTNTDDAGAGSLRQALIDTAIPGHIIFDPSLTGGEITLVSELSIPAWGLFTIDVSALPDGLTLSGNGDTRILNTSADSVVTLEAFTITEGNGNGSEAGGGIYNAGDLTLLRSTVFGNSTEDNGGGVYSDDGSSLTLINCTLVNNSATDGGAIYAAFSSTVSLKQCTLTDNAASNSGGGVFSDSSTVTLENTIVALNTASISGADIQKNAGTFVGVGTNIIGDNDTVDTEFPESSFHGTSVSPVDPFLAPIGPYGGPTYTRPPLVRSLAIDPVGGDTASSETTDQRGSTRVVDGDLVAGAIVDIGAVEGGPVITVTNADDAGTGSLRQGLIDADVPGHIIFDPSLTGGEITLVSELSIPAWGLFTIDVSALPDGLTLSGNGDTRILNTSADSVVTLEAFTITEGNGNGSEAGGGIYNAGDLTLLRSTVFGNSTEDNGGGVYSDDGSSLTLINCTLVNNSATDGGAIYAAFSSTVSLKQCTLTDNAASNSGGGVFSDSSAVTLENSIVALNTASVSGADIQDDAVALVGVGTNLIGDNDTVDTEFPESSFHGTSISPVDPFLAPLGFYGGPTQTRAPLVGSLAIDPVGGDTVSSETIDQRGQPRVLDSDLVAGAIVDIGAVEAGEVITVTSSVDTAPDTIISDTVSMRQALENVDVPGHVIFDPSLDGEVITLTFGELSIPTWGLFTIDTTVPSSGGLPNGLTLSGGPDARVFDISARTVVTMEALTITQGNAKGAEAGGGIRNAGNLTLLRSTLFENSTENNGGGIYNDASGVLTVINCTLDNNSAVDGGGIYSVSGSSVLLQECTVTDNSSTGGSGGGVFIDGADVTLENTIVAINTAPTSGADIQNNAGTLVGLGDNFIGNNDTVSTEFPESLRHGTSVSPIDPVLAPLGDYGGPTPTRSPFFDYSPVVDAVTTPVTMFDQRDFPRTVGLAPDIGAVEAAIINASPDNEQLNRSRLVNIIWSGVTGGSFELFFGTDPNSLSSEGIQSSPFEPSAGELTLGTTYYWRIDTELDGETYTGIVGSFTVRSVLEVTTVEDRDNPFVFGDVSLREAIAEAAVGQLETITFAPGLNGYAIGLDGEELLIDKSLTIDATGLSCGVNISGNNTSRVFRIDSGNVTLRGISITRGYADDASGGGIFNAGNLILSQSTVFDNNAGINGGGVYNDAGGSLTAENCTLVGNSATDGGGIYAVSGSISTSINHCTITENSASNTGGGLLIDGSTVTLENTIVAQNTDAGALGSGLQNNAGTLNEVGTNFTTGDPMLAPLDYNGGPTQTLRPLESSPVIDAAGSSSLTTDQRGYPRTINGGGGATADIGAVESFEFVTVTNSNDSGVGSLRGVLDGQGANYYHILFDAGLDGQTILLSSQLVVGNSLFTTIDASDLPDGLTISGQDSSRVFNLGTGSVVTLDSLTITEGNSGNAEGGGIYNAGTLNLLRSIVLANDAGSGNGGGIYNHTGSALNAINNTLYDNLATFGGGIYTASGADMLLKNSTVAANGANTMGGGLYIENSGNVTLKNTIVAKNSALGGSDIGNNGGQITWTSANMIGNNATVETEFPESLLHGTNTFPLDPVFEEYDDNGELKLNLADNGGPTQTLMLLTSSPAMDAEAETAGAPATDQRGFARALDDKVDLGAYEAGAGNFNLDGLTLHALVDPDLASGGMVFEISTDPDFRPVVSTLAGTSLTGPDSFGGLADGGRVTEAEFSYPSGVVQDADGNIFIADTFNHRIRIIAADGEVATIAGSSEGLFDLGFVNGAGLSAKFAFPTAVALGPNNDLYVTDSLNHCIRKLLRPLEAGQSWTVTTLAGSGQEGFLDAGPLSAKFYEPQGLVLDSAGNVYVADTRNHSIRKVTPSGTVTTLAGNGTSGFQDDDDGSLAQFNRPTGVVLDEDGNLYVADRDNHRIRKIDTTTGEVETYAGTGTAGFADGSVGIATFDTPASLTIEPADPGNPGSQSIYVSEQGNHAIRKINLATEEVSTIAGTGSSGYVDDVSTAATFNEPAGLFVDQDNAIVVADISNHRLRKIVIDPLQVAGPVVSSGLLGDEINAVLDVGSLGLNPSTTYYFRWKSLADDSTQELGQRFYLIDPPAVVTDAADPVEPTTAQLNATVNPGDGMATVIFEYSTDSGVLAPWQVLTSAGSGKTGSIDAVDPLIAEFNNPRGVVVVGDEIFIADRSNHLIRKIAEHGRVTTFAGSTIGFEDGTGTSAMFDRPADIAADSSGNLYVADEFNHCIRKITPEGVVTTFAGSGDAGFVDGAAGVAEFLYPQGVIVDVDDTVYVADTGNHVIRKITPTGEVSTFAGTGEAGFVDSIALTTSQFNAPQALALNPLNSSIYVADTGNLRIRVIREGSVSTLAGTGDTGAADGIGTTEATFASPVGIAVNSLGVAYVVDQGNQLIRRISATGLVSTLAGSSLADWIDSPADVLHPATEAAFNMPSGIALDSEGDLYVTETGNQALRKVYRGSLPTVTVRPNTYGTEDQAVSADIISPLLLRGTTYYFRATVTNGRASDTGGILSFITPQPHMQVFNGSATTDPLLDVGEEIDFGATPQDTPVIRQITISNVGGWELDLSAINVPEGYKVSPSGSLSPVAAGGSFTFDLELEATVGGIFAGEVEIVSDDPSTPSFIFLVTGEVIAPVVISDLAANPTSETEITFSANIDAMGDDTEVLLQYSLYENFEDTYEVTTLAGSVQGFDEACGLDAEFDSPAGVAIDDDGNVYIADTGNHSIRKIASDGSCSLLAGTGIAGFQNGDGSVAQFDSPEGIAVDASGNVYVADTQNHRIRKIASDGTVSTVAGFGEAAFTNGVGSAARFNEPTDVAVDAEGNLYVADSGNVMIRKIDLSTSDNEVSTVSELAGLYVTSRIQGLAVDTEGAIYIAEPVNGEVLKRTSDGLITVLINSAELIVPGGVAVDAAGDLFITDRDRHRVLRLGTDDVLTLVGGLDGYSGEDDGVGEGARFNAPTGIAVNAAGSIVVADQGNHRIRGISLALNTTTAATGLNGNEPVPVSVDLSGLTSNVPYYYRFVATNGWGTVYSDIEEVLPTFITADNDARLNDLAFNATTVPEFSAYSYDYVIEVTFSNGSITATTSSASASMELFVDGTLCCILTSGVPRSSLSLNSGLNEFDVQVTSGDGNATRTYSLAVICSEDGSPFQSWQSLYFGDDAGNDLIAGPDADPSQDGVVNLFKYALNLDPNVSLQEGLPVPETIGGDLTLTYTKVLTATDLTYVVECSTDLINWTTSGITEQVLSDDGTTQQIRASTPTAGVTTKFMRLRVTLE